MGGFHTPEQHQDIRDTIEQALKTWPTIDANPFLAKLTSLHSISTSALRGLGHLAMESTFSSGLNSSGFFLAQNEKYNQQRRIAEAFEDLRTQNVSTSDLLSDAYQLVTFLSRNDRTNAMEFVSRYLAKLLMASNWDLIKLKAHVRILLAVITSHDILNGIPWAVATSRELRHMARLEQASTTEESCYEVSEWILQYFRKPERIFIDGRRLGDRILSWMQAHYQETVTLSVASKAIGVSTSTLVHRLPSETGKTFKQLLQEIRITEAKKLLATSALDISTVAENCGFFDQSHFTHEFKRAISITPGQFRKLLAIPEIALRTPNTISLDEPFISTRALDKKTSGRKSTCRRDKHPRHSRKASP
jgi:AraC-like DNA-binding protein